MGFPPNSSYDYSIFHSFWFISYVCMYQIHCNGTSLQFSPFWKTLSHKVNLTRLADEKLAAER